MFELHSVPDIVYDLNPNITNPIGWLIRLYGQDVKCIYDEALTLLYPKPRNKNDG